jgi:rod shape-determining protein MreB
MMKYFVDTVHDESLTIIPRPRIIMSVLLEITEVERKAVEDAALGSGAREVYLVESPLLAAVGAGLALREPVGNFLVDFGGGKTEIAVISLGGIVTWKSLDIAGEDLDRDMIQYARERFNLLLGERVAEEVKMSIGSASPPAEPLQATVRGRDLITGLPTEVVMGDAQVREAMERHIRTMVEHITAALEVTPPELVADIYQQGIYLCGGGALLRGIRERISRTTSIPVHTMNDPETAVIRGAGALLDQDDLLKEIALPPTSEGIL